MLYSQVFGKLYNSSKTSFINIGSCMSWSFDIQFYETSLRNVIN